MDRKLRAKTGLVYALLVLGSLVFALPFVWMVTTSLKPIEQTMAAPPTWIPHAYRAVIDGQRIEVTREQRIDAPSALVKVQAGAEQGRRLIVPLEAYDGEQKRAQISVFQHGLPQLTWLPVQLEKMLHPGDYKVRERSQTKVRAHELAWDVVPEAAIESSVAPRWSNYPRALAAMGGKDIEEVEGSIAAHSDREGEDAQVGFLTFLSNTLIVCLLGVIGSVLSNAVIAYGLAKVRWRGRELLFGLTLATMMVPFPVLMVPLYSVFKSLGLIGSLYPLWLPSFFGSAFNIFLMRQFFLTIPDELGEAARIDGCSEWGIFWRVILPLSKPVLAVVALFHFLHAWNDFMGPLLYLTRKHTFTLALALQNYQSQNGGVQWHYLMAASTVLILPILLLFFLTQKTFVSGIATTGLKG
jgi:multiple sugar transport system permease protein